MFLFIIVSFLVIESEIECKYKDMALNIIKEVTGIRVF